MLGTADVRDYLRGFGRFYSSTALDWVICGGETGPGARAMEREWAESLLEQCEDADVPFFFKGWGTATLPKTDPGYRMLGNGRFEEFPEEER